jgi:hypothetical protein
MKLLCTEYPQTWRLVVAPKDENQVIDIEEMVFTVQGVVCGINLPPLLEMPT